MKSNIQDQNIITTNLCFFGLHLFVPFLNLQSREVQRLNWERNVHPWRPCAAIHSPYKKKKQENVCQKSHYLPNYTFSMVFDDKCIHCHSTIFFSISLLSTYMSSICWASLLILARSQESKLGAMMDLYGMMFLVNCFVICALVRIDCFVIILCSSMQYLW